MKIDDSPWPLVVITLPPILTSETIEGMRRFTDSAFRRGQRYATCVDAMSVQRPPDAIFRKDLAAMLSEPSYREGSARCVVGTSVVTTSAAVRAAGTAIGWLYVSPHPVHYASDMPSSIEWCVARMQEVGVLATPALRAYQASLVAGRKSAAGSR
jgi:hypothetical protein